MAPKPWEMRLATPQLGDFNDVEVEELLQTSLGNVEQLDEIHGTRLYMPAPREDLIYNLNDPSRRQLPRNLGIASIATMIHEPSTVKQGAGEDESEDCGKSSSPDQSRESASDDQDP